MTTATTPNETKFINLTPHAIRVMDDNGDSIIVIPPSGSIARVSANAVVIGVVNGVAISRMSYGSVTGLPDPSPGTAYIVSGMVLAAAPGRTDVYAPGDIIRGPDGQPVGCLGLRC